MSSYLKSSFFRQSVLALTGLPLLFWALSDSPDRTVLKNVLTVVTILAFCQMIGQFFWTRANRAAVADLKMRKVVNYHKIIGYIAVTAIFFHPLYLVIPRFFESGVAPADAFMTIITTLNQGVVLGIIAWSLMLTLGVTSLLRNKLPIKYKTWRIFHGILAIMFILSAAWHVIDLGRHSGPAMSALICVLTGSGIFLLLKIYILKNKKSSEG